MQRLVIDKMKCKNCDKDCGNNDKDINSFNLFDVCRDCYRDPETNLCEKGCGSKLGIPYRYICGDCFRKMNK